MIYPFRCQECHAEHDICMSPHDYDPDHDCHCGHRLVRVYTVPQVNIGISRLEYQKANEAYKRDPIRGDLVELGNENPDPPKKATEYSLSESDLRGYETLNSLPD